MKREFTKREREILHMTAHGFTYRQMASALGISENTVKTHIERMTARIGVRSRTHAVTLWMAGLATTSEFRELLRVLTEPPRFHKEAVRAKIEAGTAK